MTERPILFSAPMVRAIIEGRKTRTRRIVKWPKVLKRAPSEEEFDNVGDCVSVIVRGKHVVTCPYGGDGDRLWVRETFGFAYEADDAGTLTVLPPTDPKTANLLRRVVYRADEKVPANVALRWRPSIHMPRAACRLVLDVTDHPDLERLQEITDEEAIAEGIFCSGGHGLWTWDKSAIGGGRSPREAFLDLFGRINGRAAVRANPFVWVTKFDRALGGLDRRIALPG